tara:strand:+ start:1363 stop:2547 length:1185 start_codon:yes stop_codon:yes gene_type:complete
MGIINRVRGILWARVAKVNGIAKARIARMDAEQPSSDSPGDTFRAALMVGNGGYIEWNTGSLDNDDHWHRLDFSGDVYRDVTWGYDENGTECWLISTNKTGRPLIVAKSDGSDNWVPSGSSNWVNIKPTGGPWPGTWNFRGYRCGRGDHTNNNRATFMMGAMNNSILSTYVTGGITDSANWSQQYRGFDSSGTNSAIYGLVWNRESSDSDSIFALTIGADVWMSTNGTGSGDNGDWQMVFQSPGSSVTQMWNLQYGNDVWVGGGTNAQGKGNLTGSGAGTGSWGHFNRPANRGMRGAATNMSGNWVMGGNDGYIWYSADDAATWSEVRVPENDGGSTYRDWYDVAYDNNETWVACGERAYAVSTDNGQTWTSSNGLAGNATYNAIAFNVTNTSQ